MMGPSMMWFRCLSILLLFPMLTSPLIGQSVDELRSRLHEAKLQSSLNQKEMMSWHLLLSFDLVSTSGKVTQTGTIEEWWGSPKLQKLTYSLGAHSWTIIHAVDGTYSTGEGKPPWLATQLFDGEVYPFSSTTEIDTSLLSFKERKLKGVTLDCITLAPPNQRKGQSRDGKADLIYCLEHGQPSLLLTSKNDAETITRTVTGSFAGKNVAIDQNLILNNVLAAKSHVIKLQLESFPDTTFTSTEGMTKVSDYPFDESDSIIIGQKISGKEPSYSPIAADRRISGIVILRGTINKRGHLESVEPVYSTNPSFVPPAVDAVRTWIYEPYTLHGQPVPVNMEITINFTFVH